MLLNALSNEAKEIEELKFKNILVHVPRGFESRKYEGSWYIFKDNESLTREERKWLAKYDEDIFKSTSIHLIYNYKEILYKSK